MPLSKCDFTLEDLDDINTYFGNESDSGGTPNSDFNETRWLTDAESSQDFIEFSSSTSMVMPPEVMHHGLEERSSKNVTDAEDSAISVLAFSNNEMGDTSRQPSSFPAMNCPYQFGVQPGMKDTSTPKKDFTENFESPLTVLHKKAVELERQIVSYKLRNKKRPCVSRISKDSQKEDSAFHSITYCTKENMNHHNHESNTDMNEFVHSNDRFDGSLKIHSRVDGNNSLKPRRETFVIRDPRIDTHNDSLVESMSTNCSWRIFHEKLEQFLSPTLQEVRRLTFTLKNRAFKQPSNIVSECAKGPSESLRTSVTYSSNASSAVSMYKDRCAEFSLNRKSTRYFEGNTEPQQFQLTQETPKKFVISAYKPTEMDLLDDTSNLQSFKVLSKAKESQAGTSEKGLLHLVVGHQVAPRPMSLNPVFVATKEPFTFAKFVKSVPYKPFRNKRVFAPKVQEKSKQATLKKMGNSNLKRIPPVKLTSSPEDQQYVKRSLQRLRNGQREVHKNLWRAEKRVLSSDQTVQNKDTNANNDPDRPKIPKRATYKKGRAVQSREGRHGILNGTYSKEAASSDTNSESVFSSLPSRSDILPPDGDSLRSDIEKNIALLDVPAKCPSCSDTQLRISKAYAQKGAVVVALEKTQNDLSASQKRVKELEHDLQEVRKDYDEAMSTIKALESEMCQLQKDKALCSHELNVTRKQLTRALEQSDISDSSHVSSIYVSGSQKTLDDGLGDDVSPDDEDYDSDSARQWQKMQAERDFALEELERLKDDKFRKEVEMESRFKDYEERIAELESQLREMQKYEFESKDMSTQTLRRDGTFTRQQPDKTKIPKRLLGHHSSLPVINDPPSLSRLQLTTNSLSRLESLQKALKIKEAEIATLRSEMSELEKEREKEKQHEEIMQSTEMQDLKLENERLHKELRAVTENYLKEMVMRKKYFNMVEDLKGKIRVFCRIKPKDDNKCSSVLESPDEYTVLLKTQRAKYEFTFDSIFYTEHTQDDVFRDVQSLVQSALDGYNVCIFAYGQTGSGKTYTLVGSDSQPGIGPRAFRRIFQLVRDNQAELDFRINASVFELYNERLIDLLQSGNEDKLKIRRDRYGLVYVQGSETRQVQNENQLLKLFHEACSNRHTGSTRMNAESSRSHLIVTVLIESTNKITGTVLRGKLSIVDLAGSERVGKTAAVADQLREANSINKSLSALGDVIAALSSEQPHVPYRNNKLTLLMQDSLGSNAKTLMFVTISSAEQNVEESLNSLTYASRVKQITNSATRIAESKEIARLRSIIMKMSKEDSFGSPNRFHPTI